MFAFFHGASIKIARNLIKVTGLAESLAIFQKNTFSTIGEVEVLKLLLGMDACNLLQTMKEDFIAKEIIEEDLLDTVDDYVVENLKAQTVIACKDGAERMDQCQEILGIAARFQEYWNREDTKDPGPRFYCVKELLRRLGSEDNTPIHDNLFEFVYEQHNRFLRYFRILLEPFQPEEAPESEFSGLAFHSPSPEAPPEPGPAAGRPEKEETPAENSHSPMRTLSDPGEPNPLSPTYSLDALLASSVREPSREEGEAVETREEIPAENLFPPLTRQEDPTGPAPSSGPAQEGPEPFQEEIPAEPLNTTSQMLEDIFQKVNPIDENLPGASPVPRKFPEGEGPAGKNQLMEDGPDPAE